MLKEYALVVANGDLKEIDWLAQLANDASYVVAADGGARYLHRIEVLPDLVIGDLDSVSAEVRTWLFDADVEVIAHPVEKDETDLELTLLKLVETGWNSIQIAGAGGGRIDHFLANLVLLAHKQLLDVDIQIAEPHQSLWLFSDESEVIGKVDDIVSLIPVGGDAVVAETTGLQWELVNSRLAFGPARGVSNRLTETVARIRLAEGIVACCHVDGSWHR